MNPPMSDSLPQQDLDLTFLTEIADGSNEFIVESIGMLLLQAPELMQNIGDAIQLQDWPTAARAAHKLRPSIGFFGMVNSQSLIQQIETLCKAGGVEELEINAKFTTANEMIAENLVLLKRIKAEKEA